MSGEAIFIALRERIGVALWAKLRKLFTFAIPWA